MKSIFVNNLNLAIVRNLLVIIEHLYLINNAYVAKGACLLPKLSTWFMDDPQRLETTPFIMHDGSVYRDMLTIEASKAVGQFAQNYHTFAPPPFRQVCLIFYA